MSGLYLVADIGGTNARFALVENGDPGPVWSIEVESASTFAEALDAFLAANDGEPRITAAGIAVAGPVDGGAVKLTNAPWLIRSMDVSERLGGVRVSLFNDLEAVALALPYLRPGDIASLGPPLDAVPRARLLAVNVGTGFGAATAIPVGADGWTACPSEAGHMGLATRTQEERGILDRLGASSIEDALSGERFVALYRGVGGETREDDKPEAIMARIAGDRAASEAVRLFTVWLGRVCGDLVLATASWGGVFLSGGLVESWRAVADTALFRSSFADKGKMRDRMVGVPTAVILRPNVALFGLARVLAQA